jgi:hypothetical protein
MVVRLLMNIRLGSMICWKHPGKLEPVRAHLSLLQDFNQKRNIDLLYLHEATKVMVFGANKSAFQQVALLFLLHRHSLFKVPLQHLLQYLGMLHTMVGQLLLNIRFGCILMRWDNGMKLEPVKAHLTLLQD